MSDWDPRRLWKEKMEILTMTIWLGVSRGTLGINIRPFSMVKYFMAEQGSLLSILQQSARVKVKASDWG